jgi:hypothetical protein
MSEEGGVVVYSGANSLHKTPTISFKLYFINKLFAMLV